MHSGDFHFCQAGNACAVTPKRPPELSLYLVLTVLLALILPLSASAQISSYHDNDLIAQASAARMQNDVPRAIELYSKALQGNPKWPDGWWFLGSLQYGTGAYGPARDALSHYLSLMPDAAPAYALRGLCEFETSDFRAALTDIEEGIHLGAANQPRNAQILRYHEALLLTRLGDYESALRSYTYFAKNGITNPELFTAIGLAGLRIPLMPRDLASGEQQLASAAGDAGYRFLAGDETSATQAFQELFQHFPDAPNTHFFYGYLLFATDPDGALAQFEQELKSSPSNIDAYVMTAWALLMRNSPSDALPYAQTAAAKEPNLAWAQLVLGRSLLDTGDVKDGMEHLEKSLQLSPDNLETHIALAKAYSKSGRNEDARHERLICLRLSSGNDSSVERP